MPSVQMNSAEFVLNPLIGFKNGPSPLQPTAAYQHQCLPTPLFDPGNSDPNSEW